MAIALRAAYPLTRLEPKTFEVLAFLAQKGEIVPVETFLKHLPDVMWPAEVRDTIEKSILGILEHGPRNKRPTAARILVHGIRSDLLSMPGLGVLESLLTTASADGTLSSLAQLATLGAKRNVYPRDKVVNWLKEHVIENSDGTLVTSHDARTCQRELLRTAAMAPGALRVDELVETAFLRPVTADIIHGLTAVITPSTEGRLAWPIENRLWVVMEVGRRLNEPDIPNRARKDTAGRWRQPLFHMLGSLSADQTRLVLDVLPEMHPVFAEVVAGRLVLADAEATRNMVRNILESSTINAETKRQLAYASQRSMVEGVGWWTLDDDLQRAAG